MKILRFLVLPFLVAFALIWEGTTWSGVLMTIPNDGAFFGGILLRITTVMLGCSIVVASVTHYFADLFTN